MSFTYASGKTSAVGETFTYVAGTADSLTDVREFIGDTDNTAALLSDQTINRVLSLQAVVTYAAAACCLIIMARFARLVSRAVGTTKVEMQQQFEHYNLLAKSLQKGGPGNLPGADGSGTPTLVPVLTGVSMEEQTTILDNEDFRQHGIAVHQDDFPFNARLRHDDADDGNVR